MRSVIEIYRPVMRYLLCWAFFCEFMPPLDEGTILDMPVTIPRASMTQVADDLKARDALLAVIPRGGARRRQSGPG